MPAEVTYRYKKIPYTTESIRYQKMHDMHCKRDCEARDELRVGLYV